MTAAPEFRLREVAVAAYGPSLVSAIGHGAVAPILALRARELGASVGVAAIVVALTGIGMLMTSLPAGVVVGRIGERRALMIAGVVEATALAAMAVATSVVALGVAVVVSGAAWTVFLLARQGFIILAVPARRRARALSVLGGTFRIGVLIGPLIGAALIGVGGLRSVFLFAAGTALCAGLLGFVVPDLDAVQRVAAGPVRLLDVVTAHRHTLLTLGAAVIVIGASRSLRASLVPLWADHIGLSAATVSLVFAIAAAVDVAFFYPGGWLMDTYGRAVVAVPVVLATSAGCLLLPLTSGALGVTAVAVLIAMGNGLGSGIVMTLGADTAPDHGRAPFLGAWRLCGDIGMSGGPLVLAGVALVLPLGAAAATLGLLGVVGAGWVGFWVRRLDRRRSAEGLLSRR